MSIIISETRQIAQKQIIALYKANQWSSANKPDELYKGLINSHTLISAWDNHKLVGLGNAISDGHLMVYYPHLLVHPDYQGRGIGHQIVTKMQGLYGHFHMQMLTADRKAIAFYQNIGFERAGDTQPMWMYNGNEH